MNITAGTSVAACLPLRIAASITGRCHSQGVAVNTRSRSSVSHRRSKSRSPRQYTVGDGWPAAVICSVAQSQRSARMSQTAVIRQPGMRRKLRTCPAPCRPMPTKPMRTISMGGAVGRPPASRGKADGGAASPLRTPTAPAASSALDVFRNPRRSTLSLRSSVIRAAPRPGSPSVGRRPVVDADAIELS